MCGGDALRQGLCEIARPKTYNPARSHELAEISDAIVFHRTLFMK